MVQKDSGNGSTVDLLFLIHKSLQQNVESALKVLGRKSFVKAKPVFYHIEDFK